MPTGAPADDEPTGALADDEPKGALAYIGTEVNPTIELTEISLYEGAGGGTKEEIRAQTSLLHHTHTLKTLYSVLVSTQPKSKYHHLF